MVPDVLVLVGLNEIQISNKGLSWKLLSAKEDLVETAMKLVSGKGITTLHAVLDPMGKATS